MTNVTGSHGHILMYGYSYFANPVTVTATARYLRTNSCVS